MASIDGWQSAANYQNAPLKMLQPSGQSVAPYVFPPTSIIGWLQPQFFVTPQKPTQQSSFFSAPVWILKDFIFDWLNDINWNPFSRKPVQPDSSITPIVVTPQVTTSWFVDNRWMPTQKLPQQETSKPFVLSPFSFPPFDWHQDSVFGLKPLYPQQSQAFSFSGFVRIILGKVSLFDKAIWSVSVADAALYECLVSDKLAEISVINDEAIYACAVSDQLFYNLTMGEQP
jgi:hypothetical protein